MLNSGWWFKILVGVSLVSSFTWSQSSPSSAPLYLSPHHQAVAAIVFKIFSRSYEIKQSVTEEFDNFNTLPDQQKILRVRDAVIKRRSMDPVQVEVQSFSEFLQKQKEPELIKDYDLADIPLEKLIEMTQRQKFFSANPKVQKAIDQYEARKFEVLQTYVKHSFSALTVALQFLSQHQEAEEFRAEVEKKFEAKVSDALSELSDSSSVHVKILVKLLKGYFKKLPQKEKAEILYQLTQKPLNSQKMDLFLTLIQNAGPQLQKLIQIKGRDPEIPVKFQEIFQRLESEVKSISWPVIEKHLGQMGFNMEKLVYFERKPLGVGTMAQTHRAQFLDEEGKRKTVVLRFLKPGMSRKLQVDHKIFESVLKELDVDPELKAFDLPSLSDLVEDVHRSALEELDLEKTVSQQNKARTLYRDSNFVKLKTSQMPVEISVPWARFYQTDQVVMQELIFGKKPAKEIRPYTSMWTDLYSKIAERVATIWLEEAFFKSGFFHADLHQGNMMVHVTDEVIKVNYLDFGMTGQLTQEQQTSALLLGVGIKMKKADTIAKHFIKLSRTNKNSLSELMLTFMVKEKIEEIEKAGEKWGLEDWCKWILKKGFVLDYEFLKLNRGLSAIEGLLADSESLETFETLAKKVAFKHKSKVIPKLINEKLLHPQQINQLAEIIGIKSSETIDSSKSAVRCELLF